MSKKERIAVVSYHIIIKQSNQIYCKQHTPYQLKEFDHLQTKGNDKKMIKKKLDSLKYYKLAKQKDKSSLRKLLPI